MRIGVLTPLGRPHFQWWLAHQVRKQLGLHALLITVEPREGEPLGATRERLRLLGLEWPCDAYAFFDDDDWQSPRRLLTQAEELEHALGAAYVADGLAWFLDTRRALTARYDGRGAAPPSLALYRREVLEAVSFDETRTIEEDTDFARRVTRRFGEGLRTRHGDLAVFLRHGQNTSTMSALRFDSALPRELDAQWTEVERKLLTVALDVQAERARSAARHAPKSVSSRSAPDEKPAGGDGALPVGA
jgi:hypothetical protein